MLDVSHGSELWAQLYYQRCCVPNTILYIMDRPGPLRVRLISGMYFIFFYCSCRMKFFKSIFFYNTYYHAFLKLFFLSIADYFPFFHELLYII